MLVGCFEICIILMLTMGWQVLSIDAGRDNRVKTETATTFSLKVSVLAQNHTKLPDMTLSWTKEE